MSAYAIRIVRGKITSRTTFMTVRGVSPERIALAVSNAFGVDPARIKDRDKHWPLVDARTACAALIFELAHPHQDRIGPMLGRKPSTGWDYIQRNNRLSETDRSYRQKLHAARSAFGL